MKAAIQAPSLQKKHTGNIYAGTQKSFYEGKLSIDCSLIGELYKINSYRKNALLPNITVTFIPANDHIFQLAYNSIRSYPSYWQRQNYTSYNDEYSVSMGNPLLKPARTGNANLTYVLKNKYTFQVSYYKVEDFFIDQSYQSPEKLQLLHKTFNIDYTSLLNLTAVIPISFGNIVSSNLIANVYNERYKSNEWFELAYNRNKWTGSLMAYNTIFISKKPNITMNLMAFYRTPCIQGIWDLEDNWCINTGLRYTFAKDKAIVGLQCNDIFESLYPKIKVRFDKQYQNLNQNFYQRNITLSFTYKFNGFKDRTPKRSGYFKIWSKLTYHYEQIPCLPPARFHAVWHCLPANDMQIPWERVFTRYSFPLLLCYQRRRVAAGHQRSGNPTGTAHHVRTGNNRTITQSPPALYPALEPKSFCSTLPDKER